MIRRPLKPGPDMPGQLLGDTRHLGGMGLDLMPDADGGDLLPALLELPRPRRQLGQGRAVQRDGPDGVFQRLGIKALLKKPKTPALPAPVTRDEARDEAEREQEMARRRGASANIVAGSGAPGGLGRLVIGS